MPRRLARALAPVVVAPLLALPIVMAPPSTAAASVTRLDDVVITITSRTVIDVGRTGSSIGDLTITEGTVAANGERVGYFTTRVVVVVPGANSERRDTYVQLRLPGGALLLRQLQVDPTGAPPDSTHRMAIVGGSGPYLAARGQAVVSPAGRGQLHLRMEYQPVEGMSAFQTDSYRRVVTDTSPGNVGAGDEIAVTAQTVRGFLAIDRQRFPFACGQTSADVEGIGAPVIASWVCRYSMPGGSLVTTSVGQQAGGTPPATSVTQAVIGGTGDYAGARGEVTMAEPDWSVSGRMSVTLAISSGDYRLARPGWDRDRTGRWAVPLGERRLGEIVIAEGELAGQGASPSIGYTVRTGAIRDRRMTQFAFSIDGDTLYATAMFSTTGGQPPSTPYLALVNGGTGNFIGATGVLRVVPTGATTADINGNLKLAPVRP